MTPNPPDQSAEFPTPSIRPLPQDAIREERGGPISLNALAETSARQAPAQNPGCADHASCNAQCTSCVGAVKPHGVFGGVTAVPQSEDGGTPSS
jgi:hypothetical protein